MTYMNTYRLETKLNLKIVQKNLILEQHVKRNHRSRKLEETRYVSYSEERGSNSTIAYEGRGLDLMSP